MNIVIQKTFTNTAFGGFFKLLLSARLSNLHLTYTNTQKDRPVWWCSVSGIHSSGDL